MSDWQVGDLALCVDDRRSRGSPFTAVCAGKVYAVSGIRPLESPHDIFGTDGGGLWLEGVESMAPSGTFAAARFRKILPDAHEPCEAEFVTLLKRGKVKA